MRNDKDMRELVMGIRNDVLESYRLKREEEREQWKMERKKRPDLWNDYEMLFNVTEMYFQLKDGGKEDVWLSYIEDMNNGLNYSKRKDFNLIHDFLKGEKIERYEELGKFLYDKKFCYKSVQEYVNFLIDRDERLEDSIWCGQIFDSYKENIFTNPKDFIIENDLYGEFLENNEKRNVILFYVKSTMDNPHKRDEDSQLLAYKMFEVLNKSLEKDNPFWKNQDEKEYMMKFMLHLQGDFKYANYGTAYQILKQNIQLFGNDLPEDYLAKSAELSYYQNVDDIGFYVYPISLIKNQTPKIQEASLKGNINSLCLLDDPDIKMVQKYLLQDENGLASLYWQSGSLFGKEKQKENIINIIKDVLEHSDLDFKQQMIYKHPTNFIFVPLNQKQEEESNKYINKLLNHEITPNHIIEEFLPKKQNTKKTSMSSNFKLRKLV